VPVVSFSPPPASDHTEDVDAMEAKREGDAKTRLGTLRAKSKMVAQANVLREKLKPRFVPVSDSSSPEIVVYNRMWRNTRYVVAINDHRTFGDYVGPWGLTMEKGLPFAGTVSLADDGTVKTVYELSRGEELPFTREDGRIKVPVKYDTNDGRLLVFLRQKIASIKVDAPKSVRAGETVQVKMSVLDAAGHPIEALLPAEVRLYAADGKEIDGAGWVCLKGGTCTVEILTNLDDAPGAYRLVCRDRASGLKTERSIQRK
jgi:glutamyl/glutaminyl-tRNA synthetase